MKKTASIFAFSVLLAASCGQQNSGDKKAQLADLKKQKSELDAKIGALEKELNAQDTSKKEKIKYVSVSALTPMLFEHSLDLQGSVIADDEVYATSRMPGTVTKVYIKNGDRVQEGQLIAELDDRLVEQGMAELQNRLDLANDLYNKQKALWEQKIGSEIQYLTAKNNKDALEKTLSTMQQQKDMYRVHSPISGVVDEALVKQGQAAAPGVPLAKIVNFSKLKVKADAAETYAPRLRVGSAVKLQFPDLQKEVNSKITYVGNGVNPMNRTIKVEIALKGNEQGILPNMLSVVRLLDYSKPNALAVPINMLQKDLAGQDFILVAENGKAVKKIVKLGQISGDKVEILSGLKAGEQLVTVGYQDLNEGDTLQVQ